ncbi:hypothetical protein GCM10010236_10080 [Streptomyces eurythermus]|nr:hypothetical protein GCM10010236_10080 [Streptomyces eurythermus]
MSAVAKGGVANPLIGVPAVIAGNRFSKGALRRESGAAQFMRDLGQSPLRRTHIAVHTCAADVLTCDFGKIALTGTERRMREGAMPISVALLFPSVVAGLDTSAAREVFGVDRSDLVDPWYEFADWTPDDAGNCDACRVQGAHHRGVGLAGRARARTPVR